MLTKITIENFKSFKDVSTIDLTKTNYNILPQNVADNNVLKGCIFVGANASGKSNIILALKLLLDLLFSERNINSGMFLCMFSNLPAYKLEYEFLIKDKTIRYLITVDTVQNIIIEKLFVDDEIKLERMGTTARSYIADEKGISYDENDVGKDTLFLRTLYFNTKFTSNEVLKEWMEYLKKSVYINLFENEIKSYGKTNLSIGKYLEELGCNDINGFFAEYNFDQQIEYQESGKGENLRLDFGEDEGNKAIFFKRRGIEIPIPFREESTGNQNLLRILPSFLKVIKEGGMLLIDEFSSGFHNELETLLVKYFMEKAESSQMLFVSHSTNLLSNSILRPDQEYSVEFKKETGSSVKRFSSEQPRSAQNIEKMYVSGVFGGLPMYKEVADKN